MGRSIVRYKNGIVSVIFQSHRVSNEKSKKNLRFGLLIDGTNSTQLLVTSILVFLGSMSDLHLTELLNYLTAQNCS